MATFDVGVTAMQAALRSLDVSADNIANANTPGYHSKKALLTSLPGATVGGVSTGMGVEVEDVIRIRDELIERTMLEHVPLDAMFKQEVDSLAHIEMLFSEPSSSGLDAQLGAFFDSLAQLSTSPSDPILREQVVQKGHALAGVFNQLHDGFTDVAATMAAGAESMVADANDLTDRIATLNGRVERIIAGGGSAPDLEDLRDRLITELAGIIDIKSYRDDRGMVNLSASGTLLVSGIDKTVLEAQTEGEDIQITRPGGVGIPVDVRGGKLAGLINVNNELLQEYKDTLNDLARSLMGAVNHFHTQGLPEFGGFRTLEGLNGFTSDELFCEAGYCVEPGTHSLFVNVTEDSTGQVERFELTVDTTVPTNQFMEDLRDQINSAAGVDHVAATLGEGKLNLAADAGYRFDFATQYDPNPVEPGDFTTAAPPEVQVLDAYDGSATHRYDVSFNTAGVVGTDPLSLQVQVRDAGGTLLRTLSRNLSADYDPGDTVELEHGVKFSLGEGSVNAGDGFSVQAVADNDPAGVLSALGLNTFFAGKDAGSIAVADAMLEDTSRLAASLRNVSGDNHRVLQMAGVGEAAVARRDTMTLSESYQSLLSDLGITRNTRETQLHNQQQILRDLESRRDSISGVSVDEEMVNILQTRAVYTGAMKYIRTLSEMLNDMSSLL